MVTQDYGTELVAPEVTREGHTFNCWNPQVPATVPASNATYTAQWNANQYVVTFNANGGNGGTSRAQDYGSAIVAPTVTKTGYSLTGWEPELDATMPAHDVTYVAQWQVNQYTATFDANGGTGGTTKTQDYGTQLVAPTVQKDWHTFSTWSPEVPQTMPAEDKIYVAQWTPNTYTVTLDLNNNVSLWPGIAAKFVDGTSAPKQISVAYGRNFPTLVNEIPQDETHQFKNWYDTTSQTNFRDGVQLDDLVSQITSNRTFLAQWTEPDEVGVTLDENHAGASIGEER